MAHDHEPKHMGVYSRCMKLAEAAQYLYQKSCWIHLAEAVEIGSISPMEAYDAIGLGYLPEWLKTRNSRYAHLL